MEIYVAYAEANGHATEALSNIRTVKAMSTELQGTVWLVFLSGERHTSLPSRMAKVCSCLYRIRGLTVMSTRESH